MKLLRIDCDRPVTTADRAFLHLLTEGLLLALREQGNLTEFQLRTALNAMNQRRERGSSCV